MANKNFKVKNNVQVSDLVVAGAVTVDANGVLQSNSALPVAQGGTGQTTAQNAINALVPSQTSNANKLLGTDGTSVSWVSPGIAYQTSAPLDPVIGQLWVDSDETGDSLDPYIIRRKTITATAGQTVFTTDVTFTDGYEQVYYNGVLLVRTTDYTTSGGTNTVTLLQGASAGDTIEIIASTPINLVNTATLSTNTFTGNQVINGSGNALEVSNRIRSREGFRVVGGTNVNEYQIGPFYNFTDFHITHSNDNFASHNARITINSVGNVGIGTITPGQKLSVNGSIDAIHEDGANMAIRIRANASNGSGNLQFTNNAATSDWAYIGSPSAGKMVIRSTVGATSPGNYAWLGINGGPVQIRDILANGGEASDWPVPSLSIASFDDYTHNTMLGFLLRDDDNYILDYSKWNIKVSDTGSKTTSASTTNLHFGGPGAMILYTGNAESARLEVGGALRAKYHTGLTTSPNRFTLATGAGYFNTGWAGGLFLFHGYISGNEFWDLVINQFYGSINVISSATIGSPPTRTYASPSGGTLGVQLTGGTAGTYTIDLNWMTAG